MLYSSSCHSIASLFSRLIMLARRHDIVAIVKVKDLFKIVYTARMNLEDLAELKDYDIQHLITLGKTTQSKLTEEEKKELLVYIRECNANLN